jgi:osmotically-inducible protein OsmY
MTTTDKESIMKTRIAAAVASLLVASMGTAAYAQGAQQTTPQTTPPTSTPYTSNGTQSTQPMYNNDSNMSASRTEQQIKQQLTANGSTATNVNITLNDGTATLSGTVATQQDIAKARMEAMRVQGVKHVDTSNLQVRADNGSMQH